MMAMTAAAAKSSGKKPRKPYTITNPREKWTADEHGRFRHALFLYGRDWKRIQAFVATKTGTQIRSHAQKHFLKAQKMGLPVPMQLQPRRGGAAVRPAPPPMSWLPSFKDDAVMSEDETIHQLPLSPDHPDFALVYRFVGDVFGSDAERPVEVQLQRLLGADPVIVETILCALGNLEDNQSV